MVSAAPSGDVADALDAFTNLCKGMHLFLVSYWFFLVVIPITCVNRYYVAVYQNVLRHNFETRSALEKAVGAFKKAISEVRIVKHIFYICF